VNKFFVLKKWLALPEAAKQISESVGNDTTEADLMQAALDGLLKISVNIVNPVKVRRATVASLEEVDWLMFPIPCVNGVRRTKSSPKFASENAECPRILRKLWNLIPENERGNFIPVPLGRPIDEKRFLVLDQEITEVRGICDLPMIGDERRDIEHQYHLLTGGPVVALEESDDVYIKDESGAMCQLQGRLKLPGPPNRLLKYWFSFLN